MANNSRTYFSNINVNLARKTMGIIACSPKSWHHQSPKRKWGNVFTFVVFAIVVLVYFKALKG